MRSIKSLIQIVVVLLVSLFTIIRCSNSEVKTRQQTGLSTNDKTGAKLAPITDSLQIDTALFNAKLLQLAHNKPSDKWPVKTKYPLKGAILPFKRVVAYYGNFYSVRMGILGELPPDEMLEKLQQEVKKWELADSLTPVVPALEYIVVTAQKGSGKDGKYRMRMPFNQIDKTMELAARINAIVFLDVQVGHSTLQEEIPRLLTYLKLPNVHLAVDPEYSMKGGEVPGSRVGTLAAEDINYASNYLAQIVREYALPPKILVVHRFTNKMVTNYKNITTCPEVQIVMHMDGFGFPAKKINTYNSCIANEPVQFTGFKLFYKNDILSPQGRTLMTPEEILKLYPSPSYIHFQ